MAKTKDFYDVLGVSRTATPKEIGVAFRKLARKHHPDLNAGNKESEARFKEISEAHEVLSDPKKKQLYDEFGADWAAAQAAGIKPGEGGPRRSGGFRTEAPPGAQYRQVTPEEMEDLFGESGGIGVVFQGYLHMEYARQVFHRILPAPSGKKINFAKLSGEWVYRTCGSNSYAGDFNTGNLCRLT